VKAEEKCTTNSGHKPEVSRPKGGLEGVRNFEENIETDISKRGWVSGLK
jgi:hypothetical protein